MGCSPRLETLILGFNDLAANLGFRMGHAVGKGNSSAEGERGDSLTVSAAESNVHGSQCDGDSDGGDCDS